MSIDIKIKPCDLVVIIINYNSYEETIRTINFIGNQIQIDLKIIVIDNASSNESVAKIKDVIGTSILVVNNENIGYARAINQGLEIAQKNDISHSLIINNDLEFSNENFIAKFLNAVKTSSNFGAISPKIYTTQMTLVKTFLKQPTAIDIALGEIISAIKFIRYRNSITRQSGIIPVYRCHGSCMLIDNEMLRNVGNFDNNTFLYGEEEILAERLIKNGYRCGLYCDDFVIHFTSQTVNTVMSASRKAYLQAFNKAYYLYRYRGYVKYLSRFIAASFLIFTCLRLWIKQVIRRIKILQELKLK